MASRVARRSRRELSEATAEFLLCLRAVRSTGRAPFAGLAARRLRRKPTESTAEFILCLRAGRSRGRALVVGPLAPRDRLRQEQGYFCSFELVDREVRVRYERIVHRGHRILGFEKVSGEDSALWSSAGVLNS